MSQRNSEINELKSILSSNKDTVGSVKNLKNENSTLIKGLKKSQQKLIQFYSDFYSSKFFIENNYNFLIEKLDTDNDLMRLLSFNLIGKVSNSVIIFYNVDANKLNIICSVSKSIPENSKIDASEIVNQICEEIGGAGGGQKYYASGSGPKNDKIETIIKTVRKNLL